MIRLKKVEWEALDKKVGNEEGLAIFVVGKKKQFHSLGACKPCLLT